MVTVQIWCVASLDSVLWSMSLNRCLVKVDLCWDTMCIRWPFVSQTLCIRLGICYDKFPDGLEVYGRTADEEATYTPNVRNVTQRMLNLCAPYLSVGCQPLYILNMLKLFLRPQRSFVNPYEPLTITHVQRFTNEWQRVRTSTDVHQSCQERWANDDIQGMTV